jgi:hypothetical protein
MPVPFGALGDGAGANAVAELVLVLEVFPRPGMFIPTDWRHPFITYTCRMHTAGSYLQVYISIYKYIYIIISRQKYATTNKRVK